jgi:hypothetical protein
MGDRLKKMKTKCSVPFTAFGTGHEWHGHKPKLLWRNGFGSDRVGMS